MCTRFHDAVVVATALLLLLPSGASADEQEFSAGSLLIPMDVDYQDEGMLQAFGLLYQLLLNDVTVHWVIDPDKVAGGVDVEVAAVDRATGDAVHDIDPVSGEPTERHGYRGGPFVIAAADAERAAPIIDVWQQTHVTAVHEASEAFVADVSRTLTVAPTIAVFADGHEEIAFDYLNAAGIPDSLGQPWPESKDGSREYPGFPDVLSVAEVRGPTDESDADGALFDNQGLPVYCEIMTMHWGVNERDDEAIAEFRSFLQYPTHFMAECQAVNAVENSVNGHFLTPNGYLIGDKPSEVEVVTAHLPFGQFDGQFQTENGSEPAYSLPEGDEYYDQGVVMLTEAGTDIGENDVWMTGFVGGLCLINPKNPEEADCPELVGKVSYLGGHRYSVETPITEHSDAQGTRLFLNSLFEADCVTTVGQPGVLMDLGAPALTREPAFHVNVVVANAGPGIALDPVATVRLPDGVTLVGAVPEPAAIDGAVLTWALDTLGPGDLVSMALDVLAETEGDYEHTGEIAFRVGQNARSVTAEPALTGFHTSPPATDDTGVVDVVDMGAPDATAPDSGVDPGSGDGGGGQGESDDGSADEPDLGLGGGGEPSIDTGPSGGQATAEEGCGCTAARPRPTVNLLSLAAIALAGLRRRYHRSAPRDARRTKT